MATRATTIAKEFAHLKPASKPRQPLIPFKRGTPVGTPDGTNKFVDVKDRIKHWKIAPGDKVRLLVGKKSEIFLDETRNVTGGYKVYTVSAVDKHRNRLTLAGLTHSKHNSIRPIPEDIDQYNDSDKQQFLNQKNYLNTFRPVDYSNVQLCVQDNGGAGSVFATRVSISGGKRFAARLSNEDANVSRESKTGFVEIPWPEKEQPKEYAAGTSDTDADVARTRSFKLGHLSSLPYDMIPFSSRSPSTTNQHVADKYIFNPAARKKLVMQTAMPLYLGDELAPRFTRARRQATFKSRKEQEEAIRTFVAKHSVNEWEAQGRDTMLTQPIPGLNANILETDGVGLEGINIRPRTRKEVREAAVAKFDSHVAATRKQLSLAHADGMLYDAAYGEWYEGAKGLEVERKAGRKARKERKVLERLSKITLHERKNQFVPEELRQ